MFKPYVVKCVGYYTSLLLLGARFDFHSHLDVHLIWWSMLSLGYGFKLSLQFLHATFSCQCFSKHQCAGSGINVTVRSPDEGLREG